MGRALKAVPKRLKMELIDEPKGVVRLEIDPVEVKDLADNIREVGLLQPIVVRPDGERFEIVFGHRRFLAHKTFGAKEIDCIVRRLSDLECALARATENIQRADLSPIEEAAIYNDLHTKHDLSYDLIGKRMGKSPGVVKRRLDLLKMPAQVQMAIHKGLISYGVAEELCRLGDVGTIDYYLGYAVDHGVTVAVARMWVDDHRKSVRAKEGDVGGGGGVPAPFEVKPTYISCDCCQGPVEVGSVVYLKTCVECFDAIRKAVLGKG